MKIVQINATCGIGSTGKICLSISDLLSQKQIENDVLCSFVGHEIQKGICCSGLYEIKFQALKSRLLGNWGFNSKNATKRIIRELEQIHPDIVHLHNIHGHDCHLELLFQYFREKEIKLVWTFHDCWAFTGYCTHFTMAGCEKWRGGCGACPQKRSYSWWMDRSSELWEKKHILFAPQDMTIVAPSQWLAGLVQQSFLQDLPIKVINNGINLEIFQPRPSEFSKVYRLEEKHIVLGVSFGWSNAKGLDVFFELSKRLPENFQIVLVGTDDKTDRELPSNILSIHRTQNQMELAEIYSAADVLVNPTREENYPTVNMEAIACGTPVVTFRTGGSPEILDETCGSVVDDIDAMEQEIIRVCETKPYTQKDCLKAAKRFDQNDCFEKYVDLYKELYESTAKERI